MTQSQRTNPRFKPKFPRLQFLNKKRQLERLDCTLDRDYTIQFKPCSRAGTSY